MTHHATCELDDLLHLLNVLFLTDSRLHNAYPTGGQAAVHSRPLDQAYLELYDRMFAYSACINRK